jgi:predicted transposase YdaD
LPGVEVPDLGDLQEVNTMLAERVQEWTKEWREAGMEEGREEGRKEGREEGREEGRHEGRQHATRELLLDVIEIRFDHVPEDVHAVIGGIEDPTRLTQLHRAALQASSLDEFSALLQAGAGNPDP